MIRYLISSIFLLFAEHAIAQQTVPVRIYKDSALLPDNIIILGPELRDTAKYTITLEAHLPAAAKHADLYTIPLQLHFNNRTGKSLLYHPEAVFYHDSRLIYDTRKLVPFQTTTQKVLRLTLYRTYAPLFSKKDLFQFQVMGGGMLYIPVTFRLIYDL